MFIPDWLSRHGLSDSVTKGRSDAVTVNFVRCQVPIEDEMLDEIRSQTARDQVLQDVIKMVKRGWPEARRDLPDDVKPYHGIHFDLSVCDGLLFRQNQIVIPVKMRREMLKKLHESHQGVVKSKQRARTVMYWPGINSQIEDVVSKCSICQEHRERRPSEPLMSHPIPDRPWSKVAADLFTAHGKEYLIMVDYYSKFPEIVKLCDTSANTVIKEIKSIFARYGIPDELVSDNGPQFACNEFRKFKANWNFTHVTTSPYFAQSNGQVERTVKTIKRMFKKAVQGNDVDLMLLEYRNTPIDGTDGRSPAQLLHSRQLRSNLPVMPNMLKPRVESDMKSFLEKRQAEQKFQHDRKLGPRAEGTNPVVGENVRFRGPKGDWKFGKVVREHETPRSIVIENMSGKRYRRNRSQTFRSKEIPPVEHANVVPDDETNEREDLEVSSEQNQPSDVVQHGENSVGKYPTIPVRKDVVSSSGRVSKARKLIDM